MKNSRLLNSEISYEIAKIGHTQSITICDAGLPIPNNVKRIDLAVEKGLPSFISVLDTVISEMQVEKVFIASEIKNKNLKIHEEMEILLKKRYPMLAIEYVCHEDFKKETQKSNCIIRTGESSPYANVILYSGVVF